MAALSANVASGKWDDPKTWTPQQVPKSGDTVTIGAGKEVIVVNQTVIKGVTITINSTGTLRFNFPPRRIF